MPRKTTTDRNKKWPPFSPPEKNVFAEKLDKFGETVTRTIFSGADKEVETMMKSKVEKKKSKSKY